MTTKEKTPLAGGVFGCCCLESSSLDYSPIPDLLERIALGIERSNHLARELLELMRMASAMEDESCE